jgi:hypothetical protein
MICEMIRHRRGFLLQFGSANRNLIVNAGQKWATSAGVCAVALCTSVPSARAI